MRVAHLTTTAISLRYLVLPQLRAVNEAGGEAIGISAPGGFVAELEAAGIRHIPLTKSTRGMNVAADVRAAFQLWRILRRERPDVLHTHNPKPGLYGRVVGRCAGVPVVVNTVHGLYATPADPLAKRTLVYGLEAIAARFSHAELVQNPEDLELMERRRIVPRHKAALLGNGIDLARFDPAAVSLRERWRLRRELCVADEQILVGTVGRLVAEKGYPELFEAMALLDDRYVLVVIGPHEPEKGDALPAAMVRQAQREGVRFVGLRSDVEDLYRAMDVFVLPSHREGFPRSAMEAAAMELPIVATDIRGCRQVVEHATNGLLVPVNDAPSLARAIGELGADPSLRQRMGREGRQRALAEFDERRVVQTVMETYDRTLASVRARTSARVGKRLVDLGVAAVGLLVLMPLLLVVAALVRVFLGAPVLFRQQRPGRHGTPFTLYKFRTMREALDRDGQPLPDEQRVTRLGRILRSLSVDELPELWNVLRGHMSLVGPRPLLPDYLERYSTRQARRHDVRPGITGWAQVNGRNGTTWEERFELDVWYVENWTLWLDLRVLARTARVVVARRGISSNGHATMPVFEGSGAERSA